jgi:predicted Zn-dependent protease
MRKLSCLVLTASLVLMCGEASAQFGFTLPGGLSIGGGGNNNKSNLDVGSVVGNAKKAFSETTEEEEIAMGQGFSSVLLGAKKLLPKPAVQHYVNALGRWIASQSERPDLPWTFAVLDDPGYNAFATPGGYIFVTKGLLDRMESEAELAGVLAHEIVHVLKKHHLAAVKKGGWIGLGADVAGAVVSSKAGGNQIANQVVGAAREAIVNVLVKGLDRGDELEADRMGVVLAARAGYDPYGLPSVLQMLQSESAGDENYSLLFATHPAPSERIEALSRLLKTPLGPAPGLSGRMPAERYKEFR